jgi:hypothetical protein
MWFIIRAAFCIGIVFSMAPGPETNGEPGTAPSLAGLLATPVMRDVVDGALSTCKSDPKFCFEMAQRLAGIEGHAAPAPARSLTNPSIPEAGRLVGDTLTAADRAAAPWHGDAKGPRSARSRIASGQ